MINALEITHLELNERVRKEQMKVLAKIAR